MKANDALRELAVVTADQWGMVTTAQAAMRGITRLDLSRLTSAGHLNRLASGVYQDAGAPSSPFDDLRAAWLRTDPTRTAADRTHHPAQDVVVAGTSAAALHGIGDLPSDTHEFVAPTRRQTQRPDIHYRKMTLDPADITIADGLPVMTIERDIADLVDLAGDLSLVADALSDASLTHNLDNRRLRHLLAPHAKSAGLPSGDGAALLNRLQQLANIDNNALARSLIATDDALAAQVTVTFLEHLDTGKVAATPQIQESISAALRDALAPALQNLRESLPKNAGLDEVARAFAEQLATTGVIADLTKSWVTAINNRRVEPTVTTGGRQLQRRIAAAAADTDA